MSTVTPRPPTAAPVRDTAPSPSRASSRASSRPSGLSAVDWRVRFGALALVWGFSFLFIRLGTDGYAPLFVSLGRMLFGTAVLAAALLAKRERLPRSARTWAHLTVAAFLLNALPFSLFAYSELRIPSSLAGICNATTPLWGMVFSLVALSEDRPTRRRFAGLLLGFAGVLVVLGAWNGFSGQDPWGTVMALTASASYAIGWIYVRRTLSGTGDSHLSLSTGQLLVGTAQLAVVAPLAAPLPSAFHPVSLLAIAALGALGTGIAMLVQYGLVAEVGPTTAALSTYFIPVVATAAGAALLGEELTWNTPVGALIVLAGAALTQSRATSRDRAAHPTTTATQERDVT
ncbi:DMT family transporter [Streptomyces mobaraensis]|uniref:DMT family transporter n=1 Tax=Streptomyces mobaraensis TaxID=35621 RepID=A0A5N5W3Z6_STRMB|nr:DMT family transporter [Streptomyces mobaraensis]KAB7836847.1 DMT family transporter [Streptomyces mobaraensis]